MSIIRNIILALVTVVSIVPITTSAGDAHHIRLQNITEEAVVPFKDFANMTDDSAPRVLIVNIDSGGGSVYDGYVISDILERTDVPVICIVDHSAMSMAMFILQSCELRISTPRSSFMVHAPSMVTKESGLRSSIRDSETQANALQILGIALESHITSRSKITRQEYAKMIDDRTVFFTPEQALEFGFIDLIMTTEDAIKYFKLK